MLKTENFVPEVYYRYSRDFQLLGRLFDSVLNYPKSNADMIYTVPDCQYASSNLIILLAKTLGFQPKHEYDNEQLRAACGIIPELLKYKGTLKALEILCKAVLKAEGLMTVVVSQISKQNPFEWQIFLPDVIDRTLIEDLLDYILPAGMSCAIFTIFSTVSLVPESQFQTTDVISIRKPGEQGGEDMGEDILNRSTLCTSSDSAAPDPTPIITGDLTKSSVFVGYLPEGD